MRLSFLTFQVDNSGSILVKHEIIILIQLDWLMGSLADRYNKRLDVAVLEICSKKSIIILIFHMKNHLVSVSTGCYSSYFVQGYFSFDAVGQKRRRRGKIYYTFVSHCQSSLLPFVNMVDLDYSC